MWAKKGDSRATKSGEGGKCGLCRKGRLRVVKPGKVKGGSWHGGKHRTGPMGIKFLRETNY